MAVIDVVKWNAAPGVFAWKFPSQELSTKTQLIVSESQEAVLIKEGNAVGPFGPGRHVLDTRNYPILTSLVKVVTGDSPFTAEVWFIQRAFKLDIKWGTVGAIQVEDPKYHIMLPVRGFGQYGIVVEDSRKFLLKLVGTLPAFVERTLSDYFRGVVVTQVKDTIGKSLIEKNISVLQMSAHLTELSQSVSESVSGTMAEYGLRLVNFTINSISTDDNDPAVKKLRDALATKAEMEIVGYNYQQKRSFDTMEAAAGNPGAGGVMNAGIGMGVGMGMGVPMGGMMGGMMGQMKFSAPKKCPSCKRDVDADTAFCPHCGSSMKPEEDMIICDKCGTKSPHGTKFCPNCGDVFFCCPECGADNPEDAAVCRQCGKPLPVKCPKCGKQVRGGVKFCPECGNKLTPSCGKCGADVPTGVKFCPNCGNKIN